MSGAPQDKIATEVQRARELLVLAYWWHAGLRHLAPDWVQKHPLWPANNDKFDIKSTKGPLATPVPGRDRLWEAIAAEFGLDMSYEQRPTARA